MGAGFSPCSLGVSEELRKAAPRGIDIPGGGTLADFANRPLLGGRAHEGFEAVGLSDRRQVFREMVMQAERGQVAFECGERLMSISGALVGGAQRYCGLVAPVGVVDEAEAQFALFAVEADEGLIERIVLGGGLVPSVDALDGIGDDFVDLERARPEIGVRIRDARDIRNTVVRRNHGRNAVDAWKRPSRLAELSLLPTTSTGKTRRPPAFRR